jgi:UDP-N-acetylmuramoylalanine--D-glutamate ligase
VGRGKGAILRAPPGGSGMPHRLEYVRRVGGVEFFNDSKATNKIKQIK